MATTAAKVKVWRRSGAQFAAENPVLENGEIAAATGNPPIVKIGDGITAWNNLVDLIGPALVADDPTEVDLDTDVGGTTTTLTLLDTIARLAHNYTTGQYYWNAYGTAAAASLTQDLAIYMPAVLRAGTIDRIGVDVIGNVAGQVYRLGIYADNGGQPDAIIAEATSTADATTAGIKDLTIAATIPTNGRYWFACVQQGGATATIAAAPGAGTGGGLPIPLGTTAVGGILNLQSRTKSGVSGGLLPNAAPAAAAGQSRFRCHFRYSA